jgi:hypothetical protein
LRRQADEFVDLTSLMPRIGRDPGERLRSSETRRTLHANYGTAGSVGYNAPAFNSVATQPVDDQVD